MPFFLYGSLVGGVDVARRALHAGLPLRPGFREFWTRLPDGPARVFLVDIIGLLPGTIVAGLDEDRLTLHLLDRTQPTEPSLRRLEDVIAAVHGETLAKESAR